MGSCHAFPSKTENRSPNFGHASTKNNSGWKEGPVCRWKFFHFNNRKKKKENSSIFRKNEVKITFQLPAFMVSQDWKQQIAFRRTLHPSISPRSNTTPMTLISLPLIVASVQKSDTAEETHEVKHEFRDDYRRIARSESYRRIRRRRISHFSI